MAAEDYTIVAEGPMCPAALLAADISFLTNSLSFTDLALHGSPALAQGDSLMIDDEIMVITGIPDEDTILIGRGCADTIPAEHTAGSTIWFFDSFVGTDGKEYAEGETIGVKLLPFTTSGGSVPVTNSVPHELAFQGRFNRPYPPANLRVNTFPWFTASPGFALDEFNETLRLTWSTRNRVLQADQLVHHTEGSITGEAGQVVSIAVYNADGDVLVRLYESTTFSFNYTRSMATRDFGFIDVFDPPDAVGYLIIRSRRGDAYSLNSYRVDFDLVPDSTTEQPFGLGYRLGELLGGFPAGSDGEFKLTNASYLFNVSGKHVFTKYDSPDHDIYVSEDGGRTFYLAVDGGPYLAFAAGDGIFRWVGTMGDQWAVVGLNRYALTQAVYDGTGSDLTTSNETLDGPFTDSAESLHVGFFGVIGSYYYAVARYADDNNSNTNLGKFYLFRAGTDLEFELVGEMTKHPSDPNGIPDDQQGSFTSWWFTPNGSSPGIYESNCVLWRGYAGRWFCKNTTQLYYTDDPNGCVNWKRCPIPKYDSHLAYNTRPLTVVPHPSNGMLLAHYAELPSIGIFRSTDNGINWTTQAPNTTGFSVADTLRPMFFFDGKWMLIAFRVEGSYYVLRQSETTTGIFPAEAAVEVQGLPEETTAWQPYLDAIAFDTVIARDGFLSQMFTEDGINFEYGSVTAYGVVFLQNFTTNESDETGTTTPVLWNDAAVSGGVVQFSGDGYMRVPQPNNTFNFGKQNFTFETFVQIDDIGGALPDQWVIVYGDLPNERNSSAMSIQTFSSGSSTDVGFRVRVQFRNAEGVITTHMMSSSVTFDVDTLHHVVIQRRDLRLEFFVNGTLIDDSTIASDAQVFGRASGAMEDVFFGGGPEVAGTGTASDNPMTGSISATRLTRGSVVYPYAGFTPPSLPLTA